MSNQGRQGDFSNNKNYPQGWRSNQNQNVGWKQDVSPSSKQGPFQQQQQQQPLYPSFQERLRKFEDTLEKITYTITLLLCLLPMHQTLA